MGPDVTEVLATVFPVVSMIGSGLVVFGSVGLARRARAREVVHRREE